MTLRAAIANGDSLTAQDGPYGITPYQGWPTKLMDLLAASGASVIVRNGAVSGYTTANMITRMPVLVQTELQYGSWPVMAILFGGVNDPGVSISGPTTTLNLSTLARMYKSRALNAVAGQASLPAGITSGTNYIVMADTSTTGGNTAALTGALTGVQAGIQTWQSRNGLAAESGWGRISTPTNGTSKILMVTPQFLNFPSGGDTMSTHLSHSGQNSSYLGVDTAVKNAATAESTAVLDLYSYMQDRLISTQDPQNSGIWHVLAANQHFNDYGGSIVGQAVYDAIVAAGWLPSLQVP